jgi:hypothetical protein
MKSEQQCEEILAFKAVYVSYTAIRILGLVVISCFVAHSLLKAS